MWDGALKIGVAVSVIWVLAASTLARGLPQSAGGKYQVVAVCSLLSLAEVKKLAPWEPHLDNFAKGEEEPIGSTGSSCNYPTVFIQVMQFQQSFIDAAKKTEVPVEPISGVGEYAYVRNNRDLFAELIAKVGPHTLTVQLGIGRNKTFESAKRSVIAIAQVYAAKLP